MDFGDPQVSVLMLTRNHAPYLAQAITSVRSQSFPHWQLLIGEDSSTDDTASIALAAAASDPARIQVFRSPSGPIGFHRNFARLLAAASSPYVAFLEGDDWWSDPDKLVRQVRLLDRQADLSFCGGRTVVIDQRNGFAPDSFSSLIGPPPYIHRLSFVQLIADYSFHFSTVMMRRHLVRLPPWIYRQYCLDRPLYLLAAAHGDAGVIDAEISVYRLHDGGVWAPLSPLQKSRRSEALFGALCSYFPRKYRHHFRVTLSHIHWSYLAESLRLGTRRQTLAILAKGVLAAPRLRLLQQPLISLGVLRRVFCFTPSVREVIDA